MKLSCRASSFLDITEGAAVLFCYQSSQIENELLEKIDILSGGAVREMFASGEFDGSAGKEVVLHRIPEMAAGRIILAGVGTRDSSDADALRKAAGQIGKLALSQKLKSVALYHDGVKTEESVQALAEGFILGSYRYLDFKTENNKDDGIHSLTLVVPLRGRLQQAEKGMTRAKATTGAVISSRNLSNRPGNDLYPEVFAKHIQKLAKANGVDCRVLGPAEIRKEKMGCLEGVGQGSVHPPRFVILKYSGKGSGQPVVLVGKGITFDSGGISIKPAQDMWEMKGDMTGAAIVVSVMMAAAQLKAKVNLVGLVPLAENMPSGDAIRPGDVLTSRRGLTVEIISTDAEGRLIMADALDYADTFKPQAVIDIATLTGAALYILGFSGAPFVGINPELNDQLRASSVRTGEKIWEMPLWPEYAELIKSSIADLKNSGGRPAGTLTAASFLRRFIKDWPWAHVDIAYCDLEPSGLPYIPKGPTGFGVRLLLDLILNWKKVS